MYKGDGDQMIGMESKKYGKLLSWEGLSYKDIYTIDPGTGLKNKVLKRLSSTTVL